MRRHRMIERVLDRVRDHSPKAHVTAKAIADTLWQDDGTLDYSREHVNLVVARMKRHK